MAPKSKSTPAVAAPSVAAASVAAPAPPVETVPAEVVPVEALAAAVESLEIAPSAKAPETSTERVASLIERVTSISSVIKDLGASLKDALSVLKVLQKDVLKDSNRRSRRATAAAGGDGEGAPRKLSGFAKPTQLSSELCEFLGVPESTLMARTEVTRLITKYVKDNELSGKEDKRTINPDGKLTKLLAIKEGADKVTYFNLQTHIRHHFIKADAAAASAAAVPVAAA